MLINPWSALLWNLAWDPDELTFTIYNFNSSFIQTRKWNWHVIFIQSIAQWRRWWCHFRKMGGGGRFLYGIWNAFHAMMTVRTNLILVFGNGPGSERTIIGRAKLRKQFLKSFTGLSLITFKSSMVACKSRKIFELYPLMMFSRSRWTYVDPEIWIWLHWIIHKLRSILMDFSG